MRRPWAWAVGAFTVARFLRRRSQAADPRADELRRKLAESRELVEERDEFEGGEVSVDRAEPATEDPESRRRTVHESARAAAEQMRRG